MKNIFLSLLIFLQIVPAFADEISPIQRRLMQSRTITSSNFYAVSYAICDALMDMSIAVNCSLNLLDSLDDRSGDLRRKRILSNGLFFQGMAVRSNVNIRLSSVQDGIIKIRVNISDLITQKEILKENEYLEIFAAIEKSLYIESLNLRLGADNE